ncbi:MAG: adenylate/guanylate cyclase domain-containing protein [Gloeocapsa sp. UFS-A4-WI-NPMV-4B04]|jgi:class 3 adenylate cyclase|nr:adenylate/guanylate cyclase domain-containing protein [Gloeocapsa sp. UFS-A4-WI-NPMV-4B04]
MLNLPIPVRDYIDNLTVDTLSPAYLLAKKDGRLSNWGGKWSVYGITNLQQEKYVAEQLFFLEGLLPLDEVPIFLPCIKIKDEIFADVHLFSGDEGDWVLLLDATLEEKQRSLMQQKGNDLSLLRKKQAKVLNQYFSKNDPEDLAKDMLDLELKGERKDITILFADIRGFTAYSENNPPDIVFKTLNLYLLTIIQPILEEAGMVDKIIGDAVMGLFGVLASTGSAQTHAVKAALKMIEAIKNINTQQSNNSSALDIGIGIASGPVALGIIDSKNGKTFSAIGYHVNFAVSLENQASSSEIIIDVNTFNKIDNMQEYFLPTTFLDEGTQEPKKIYSYLVK